jgi:hypothetical protein
MRGQWLAAAAVLLGGGSAAAADPICADRPGKASPSCTVPARRVQLETGLADWSLQRGGGERDTSLVFGATALKYGASDRWTIELDVTPYERDISRAGGLHERASSFGDVMLRSKYRLTADGSAVGVALYPFVKLPAAKHSIGNGKTEAGIAVPVDFDLGKSAFSLNLAPEVDWLADADGRGHHAAMVQVASLGWSASERLSLSAEVWGQWDYDPVGTGKQASADGAVAYLVNDDLQLDAGANFGLNRHTADLEIYGGVARRF